MKIFIFKHKCRKISNKFGLSSSRYDLFEFNLKPELFSTPDSLILNKDRLDLHDKLFSDVLSGQCKANINGEHNDKHLWSYWRFALAIEFIECCFRCGETDNLNQRILPYISNGLTHMLDQTYTDAVIRCLIYERIRNNEEVNTNVIDDEVLQAVLDFKGQGLLFR